MMEGLIRNVSQSVDTHLRKIQTIAKANDEIIRQIGANNGQVNLVTYVISRQNDGSHVVTEQRSPNAAQTIISQWRATVDLIKIPDIFNDKINYNCGRYQDLVRLNRDMLLVAQKYELFGDGTKAIREINKFEDNFRLVQTALQQLLQMLKMGGDGHLTDIQQQLDNVNNQIKDMRDKYKNLRFA